MKVGKHERAVVVFAVLILLAYFSCFAAEKDVGAVGSDEYQPGLLDKVIEREKVAEGERREELPETEEQRLLKAKQTERVSDMGSEREHEFDFENTGGYGPFGGNDGGKSGGGGEPNY